MIAAALHIVCDAFFILFGVWTLTQNICYFFNLTFIQTVYLGASAAGLSACIIISRLTCPANHQALTRKEIMLICLFLAAAIILTLCLNRPDSDDEFYLAISASVLDYPDIPLRSIPTGVFLSGYSLTSQELLKAALTYLTGIPLLYSYYLIVPAFLAVFVVLIHWRLLQLLIGRSWAAGMFFFFVVMLAWGDVHRTHANFCFVRLFQAKAAFVSIIVPGLIFYFLKYLQTSKARYAVLLFFATIAGVGTTPTGIIVEPLLLGTLILASTVQARTKPQQLVLKMSFMLFPLFMGIVMVAYFKKAGSGLVFTVNGLQPHTTNYEMLTFVVGESFRGMFALLCFLISPWCVRNDALRKPLRNFVLLCTLLLLLPGTSEALGKLTQHTAAWRWLWIMPFPAVMAIVMGRVSEYRRNIFKVPIGPLCVAALSLLFILSSPRFVLSSQNYTRFTWPMFKLHDQKSIFLRAYGTVALIKGGFLHTGKTGKRF